jgi:hypothetical protein
VSKRIDRHIIFTPNNIKVKKSVNAPERKHISYKNINTRLLKSTFLTLRKNILMFKCIFAMTIIKHEQTTKRHRKFTKNTNYKKAKLR